MGLRWSAVLLPLLTLQALLLDRSAFHSLLGKLDSLRSMWRFEVRGHSVGERATGGAVADVTATH